MKKFTYWLLALLLTTLAQGSLAAANNAIPLNHIVAVADDDVILRSELDSYLQGVMRQLQNKGGGMPDMSALEKQGLERLIVRSLQLQKAKKTGILVDDATLNKSIQGIARKNNLTLDQFRQALVNDNINYEAFREDIRNEIIISRLRKRDVVNRIRVNDQETADYLAREKDLGDRNKLIKFSHILIGLPDAATPEQIQSAHKKGDNILQKLEDGADFSQTAIAYSDGQKAMEGGTYDFRPITQIPPLFAKIISTLKLGEISSLYRSPYGFHILKLEEIKGQPKHIILQTKLRHILIRPNTLVSSSDAKIRLSRLKERLDQGDNFDALARAHSDDTLSAKDGGSLGWVGPGDTVPQFEQAFSPMSIGEISDPFKSRFGWHIVQVQERRQFDNTKKFKKSNAINNIKKQKTTEELQSWLRRLRDEAYVEYRLEQHKIQ
ncbi:MAG: molecular chaperone SurA [Gammaproteobacteria bacterium]|nr:molecular chaperone SurA [Gammaproteobacteria bacterium]